MSSRKDGPTPRASTLDITMLAVAGAANAPPASWNELLARAGFRLDTVLDTPSPRRIVRAPPI